MKQQATFQVLGDDSSLLVLPEEAEYAVLVVIASPSVSTKWRDQIISDIVNSSCRYALTFGHGCELWHDVFDETIVGDGTEEPSRFIMTTWHDAEPIEDVVDFLCLNTSYDDFESERLAIVFVGADERLESAITERLAHHNLQAEQDAVSNP